MAELQVGGKVLATQTGTDNPVLGSTVAISAKEFSIESPDGLITRSLSVDNNGLTTFNNNETDLDTSLYDSGWISLVPYLVNNWVQYDSTNYAIYYRQIGKVVHFTGLVKNGGAAQVLSGLPTEITPLKNHYKFAGMADTPASGANDLVTVISTNGGLYVSQGYSTNWSSIAISYPLG